MGPPQQPRPHTFLQLGSLCPSRAPRSPHWDRGQMNRQTFPGPLFETKQHPQDHLGHFQTATLAHWLKCSGFCGADPDHCRKMPESPSSPHALGGWWLCAPLGDLLSVWLGAPCGKQSRAWPPATHAGAEEPSLGLLHLARLQHQRLHFFWHSLVHLHAQIRVLPAELDFLLLK